MRPRLWLLLLLACSPAREGPGDADPGSSETVSGHSLGHPPGTVLTVSGIPASATEIDRWAAWIGIIHPETTRPQLRRLALVQHILPRLAVRAREPEARAYALAAAQEAAPPSGRITTRQPDGSVVEEVVGNWKELGYLLWGTARELEPGTWSAALEDVGRFVRVRLEEPPRAVPPYKEELRVTVASFPYRTEVPLDRGSVEAAIDASRLEILDPLWKDVIPESWKHRMRGEPQSPDAPSPPG